MLNRYRGLNSYRGFESHPLRHLPDSIELFASAPIARARFSVTEPSPLCLFVAPAIVVARPPRRKSTAKRCLRSWTRKSTPARDDGRDRRGRETAELAPPMRTNPISALRLLLDRIHMRSSFRYRPQIHLYMLDTLLLVQAAVSPLPLVLQMRFFVLQLHHPEATSMLSEVREDLQSR